MKNLKIRYYFILILLSGFHLYKAPPPVPGGGGGPTTPGAPASPIDTYIFVLIAFAIMFVIHFAKNYKKQTV